MTTCSCGHAHCCHPTKVETLVEDVNETGHAHQFIRRNCGECGAHIGDEIIKGGE